MLTAFWPRILTPPAWLQIPPRGAAMPPRRRSWFRRTMHMDAATEGSPPESLKGSLVGGRESTDNQRMAVPTIRVQPRVR